MVKKLLMGLVLVLLSTTLSLGMGKREPKLKLVYGKWGNKLGEFGVILPSGEEGELGSGPNDFFVDEKDFIYILDNVNNRVQVFNSSGKFIRIDPSLYSEVVKMGLTRRIILNGEEMEVGVGLIFSKEVPHRTEYPHYWGYRERKTEEKGIFARELTFTSGKTIKLISEERKPFGMAIFGKDENKNVYIGIAVGRGIFVEIIKVDEDKGEILGKIKIGEEPLDYYYTTSSIRLSPGGDIYTMNSDKNGFWIDCYPTELFDKPEGRDFTYLYLEEVRKFLMKFGEKQ